MTETLWNGMVLETGPEAFALSTDSILVADFMRLPPRAAVCDLGCGCGTIGLLLCARRADCRVTGIEIMDVVCAQAAENIRRNSLSERFSVLQGDLRNIKATLPANQFSHVISNPPYFEVSNPSAPSEARAAARSEQTCTITDLCAAAAWLLTFGGTFTLVYRPERLCDLFCALRAARLEPKRIRFVRHRPSADVSLVLLEAKYGGKPGLVYEQDLILYGQDGNPSEEFMRIYHHQKGGC